MADTKYYGNEITQVNDDVNDDGTYDWVEQL